MYLVSWSLLKCCIRPRVEIFQWRLVVALLHFNCTSSQYYYNWAKHSPSWLLFLFHSFLVWVTFTRSMFILKFLFVVYLHVFVFSLSFFLAFRLFARLCFLVVFLFCQFLFFFDHKSFNVQIWPSLCCVTSTPERNRDKEEDWVTGTRLKQIKRLRIIQSL